MKTKTVQINSFYQSDKPSWLTCFYPVSIAMMNELSKTK